MTAAEWAPIYDRLNGGLQRKGTPAQSRAYYDALSQYPVSVVAEAVKIACSRTWPPTHPHAGDIVDLARQAMQQRRTPAAVCDVCHGDGWTIEELPEQPYYRLPGRRGDPVPPPTTWTPQQARRCWQCRPSVREGAA